MSRTISVDVTDRSSRCSEPVSWTRGAGAIRPRTGTVLATALAHANPSTSSRPTVSVSGAPPARARQVRRAAGQADLDPYQSVGQRLVEQPGDLEPAELQLVGDLDLGPSVDVVPPGHRGR